MFKILLFSVLFLFVSLRVLAQDNIRVVTASPSIGAVSHDSLGAPVWIHLGLGGGSPGIAYGVNLNLGFRRNWLAQVGLVHSETFQIFTETPEESVYSLGVQIGKRLRGRKTAASLSTGSGVVFGFHRGEFLTSEGWFGPSYYKKDHFQTVGLLLNMQACWLLWRYFGFGLSLDAGLNTETSYVVLLLSLQVGNSR